MKIVIINYWQFNNVGMVAIDWWTKMDPTKTLHANTCERQWRYTSTGMHVLWNIQSFTICESRICNKISMMNSFIWFILVYTNAQTLITRTQVGWWICLCAYILCECINIQQSKTDKLEHKGHARDDVIKWNYFPCYWSFVRGIHRSPVNYPHKVQWRAALMFSLIFAWTNIWANNRDAGDFRHHRPHYDVIVMHQVGTPDPDSVICH